MNEEMKNQTEQLPLLKVHMMGSFFLEYGDQPISFRKTMATKSMRLLQIFLYNKDNGISRGRLLESTYGREDVADAANSLRVGVHRLKRSLVEAGLPQFEYIYTQKGVYHWTSPMPVESRPRDKRLRYMAVAERAVASFQQWLNETAL